VKWAGLTARVFTLSEPLTDEDLLKILKDEEADAASYYDSELAAAQTTAMDRFHARPFGDEIEGRSQVVTHDVEDTINWIMPKLMRAFMEADELISVDDPTADDAYNSKCAADYLKHIFFKDNDGETELYDYCFDALLQRLGVMRVAWQDPEPKPPRMLEGVSIEILQKYLQDPEYEILEQEQTDESTFALKVQHKPKMGRCVVEALPPEECAFSRRSASGKRMDYFRWKHEVFLADLLRQFPDSKAELAPDGESPRNDEVQDVASDGRADARFPDETSTRFEGGKEHVGRRKVYLVEEDIRVDFDGDGITEMRHIKRVGDVILENVEVERSEYHVWTPIRVAHRMAGRSLADTLLDLMRIRTVILRNTLDSMSQSLVPRHAVNTNMVDDETITALLDADIGGYVPVKGNVNEAIQPLITPDLSGQGLVMLEYMDQRVETATGVTRHSQGLRPEAITETKGGIEALQGAANERVELVARWLAKGLQEVFETILHNVASHQDQPRIVKIKGKPMQIDPRTWSDEMSVDVSVGMATENRQMRLVNLGVIAAKQEQVIATAGPSNPICGVQEIRTTYAMMAEQMGMKAPERFFKEIPEDYQPPPPPPDPKVAEVQAKMQLEGQKAQQQAQLDAAKMQFDQQMQTMKLQGERELAMFKAQSEQQISAARLVMEERLAQQRMVMEARLDQQRMEMEAAQAERDSQRQAEVGVIAAKEKAKANGSLKKNRPGGDLSQ
jgi:hypothetical protein